MLKKNVSGELFSACDVTIRKGINTTIKGEVAKYYLFCVCVLLLRYVCFSITYIIDDRPAVTKTYQNEEFVN